MKASVKCPECGAPMSTQVTRCSCGWQKPDSPKKSAADHRCVYRPGERRCPLPGTISPAVHASERWYCRLHYRTVGDPQLGEAALYEAEEGYEDILAEYRNGRKYHE